MDTFHPVAAHFAVVLPLVAVVFAAIYTFSKNGAFKKSATVIWAVATVMVGLAYFSGEHDAHEVVGEVFAMYDSHGMHELKEHAALGFNLLIAMIVVLVLNIASYKITKPWLGHVVLAGMLGVSVAMLAQGKEGGEIVYKHGKVFEAHAIIDTIKEAKLEIEDADTDAQKVESCTFAIDTILPAKSQ